MVLGTGGARTRCDSPDERWRGARGRTCKGAPATAGAPPSRRARTGRSASRRSCRVEAALRSPRANARAQCAPRSRLGRRAQRARCASRISPGLDLPFFSVERGGIGSHPLQPHHLSEPVHLGPPRSHLDLHEVENPAPVPCPGPLLPRASHARSAWPGWPRSAWQDSAQSVWPGWWRCVRCRQARLPSDRRPRGPRARSGRAERADDVSRSRASTRCSRSVWRQ